MSIFAGARERARGIPFTLPATGIEGQAYGLAPSIIRSLMKQFAGSDFLKVASAGDFAKLVEPGTESLAYVIAVATRQEPEATADILELPLQDQKVLTIACMKATFGDEGPEDFFADWGKQLGLAGILSKLQESNPVPAIPSNDTTAGEIGSKQGEELTPEQEEALLNGETLPTPSVQSASASSE